MVEQQSGKAREDDPRFQRSLKALLEAVTALVDAEPIQGISITRVVEAAGVTRPTFYQHFPDVQAASQRAALVRMQAAFADLRVPSDEDPANANVLRQSIERRALPVLEHLDIHRSFYLRIIENAATAGFFEEVVRLVAANLLLGSCSSLAERGMASREDISAVLAGGNMWLVIRWMRGEFPQDDAAMMARRLGAIAASFWQFGDLSKQ